MKMGYIEDLDQNVCTECLTNYSYCNRCHARYKNTCNCQIPLKLSEEMEKVDKIEYTYSNNLFIPSRGNNPTTQYNNTTRVDILDGWFNVITNDEDNDEVS